MDFDWLGSNIDLTKITPREIEESFEDPFALKLLPDQDKEESRYFNLGRSMTNRYIFAVFWTDGKKYRVIAARSMTEEEIIFTERKYAEMQS